MYELLIFVTVTFPMGGSMPPYSRPYAMNAGTYESQSQCFTSAPRDAQKRMDWQHHRDIEDKTTDRTYLVFGMGCFSEGSAHTVTDLFFRQ
jgi:hypothetical protein